ncbi:MAG: hypothetical protein IK066_11265 [Kiritimatiellae bacterium]|nr:hypothetical protein [Kiritimatiellia bacterium]
MKSPSRLLFTFHFSLFTAVLCAASEPAPTANALRAEADALAADIATRLGSSVRPGVPFPGYRPPVAPDADPYAAIAPDALENDRDEFARMATRLSKGNSLWHPPTPDDVSILADTLPRLTNLAAAADAFATPGYRSSLPGLVFPPDGPAASPDMWFAEPRLPDALVAARYLVHRIRLALAQGDTAAALADRARLLAITEIFLREPSSIGPIAAVAFRNPAAFPNLPPDALADAARDASSLADDLEARWPDLLLSSFHCMLDENLDPNLYPAPDDIPADVWPQTLRLAALRRLDTTADAIRAALVLPPGPERSAAFPAPDYTIDPELPIPELFAKITVSFVRYDTFFALSRSRDNASIALAAVALLRYHRDSGALPDTLDVLVPDYLPALPVAFADGAPLAYTPSAEDASPGFTLSFPDTPHAAFFPLPAP